MFMLFAFVFAFVWVSFVATILRRTKEVISNNFHYWLLSIISIQSLGSISCLRGSWSSTLTFSGLEVGTFTTVSAFFLEHTLQIFGYFWKWYALFSAPHPPHCFSLCFSCFIVFFLNQRTGCYIKPINKLKLSIIILNDALWAPG